MLRISVHLLTCAGREASLADTLASWARCDFASHTPRVFFNTEPGADAGQRVFDGFVQILREALDGRRFRLQRGRCVAPPALTGVVLLRFSSRS